MMLHISIFSQKIVAIIYIVSDGGTIPNVTSSAAQGIVQGRDKKTDGARTEM